MESIHSLRGWPTIFLLAAISLGAAAQPDPLISSLSTLDRQYMSQQRELVDDLARRHFGLQITGDRGRDLDILQRLLDEDLVGADQTRELQAMGVVMGDLLAQELDLRWVIYEDHIGRTRALRYRQTDNYLFPVTMISRRREAGNDTPVADIYQKAHDIMVEARPALPFQ